MADPKTKVHLLSQAKVGDRWIPAGDQDVTAEELEALRAEGLIDGEWLTGAIVGGDFSDQRTFTVAEWEAAVQAAALKLAGQTFDGELGRLEAEVKEILAKGEVETAELQARLTESETARANLDELVASLRQANGDLTDQLNARADNPAPNAPGEKAPETAEAGETPARTDTPPSEKAAKTAPKKGAAATTKG